MGETYVEPSVSVTGASMVDVESGSRLSWRSIFGGTFAALGIWILLSAFGFAIGLSAVSPENPRVKGVGIWLGIWSLVAPILAMFVGTLVATRSAGALRRGTGVLYGVVVWGLTTVLGTIAVANMTGALVSGAVKTVGGVASGVGRAASGAVSEGGKAAGAVGEFLKIDSSDLLARINGKLRETGKPPLAEGELKAVMQDAAGRAVREGELSAETIAGSLAANTRLTREDAREVAGDIKREWDEKAGAVVGDVRRFAGDAQDTALTAVDRVGKGFWVVFGALALGLGASMLGGVIGTHGRLRFREVERVPVGRYETAPAPT